MKFLSTLGTAIDSIANELAPTWGARRSAARHRRDLVAKQIEMLDRIGYDRLGYSWPGVSPSDSRDGRYLGTRRSPDEAIEHDLPELRQRCVELYRGNTVAHSAVEGRVANEVGTGLTRLPKVRPDDVIDQDRAEAINDRLKDVCDRWSEHGVDGRRRLSMHSLQRLACRTFANYGEVFVLVGQSQSKGPIGLTLDIISPERVETPPEFRMDTDVRMGIRYQGRTIVGYYVRRSHPDASNGYEIEYDFEPRFDAAGNDRVIHVFDPEFPEQTRGVPWLATAMNRIKDTEDFFEAELIAKQIEACLGLIITGGKQSASPMDLAEGAAKARRSPGDTRLEDLSPGFIHYAGEGEDVKTVDPQRPGSSFAPFIEQSLRGVAAACNFPYEVLAKNFFRTTFSSGRLAMLDGWMGFSMRQQVLIEQLLMPVWRVLVFDALFAGELDGLVDPFDYFSRPHVYQRHKWQSQARGFVDPDKEVRAAERSNKAGLQTKAALAGERGEDWEDVEEQLDIEERKKIILRIEREVWENEQREAAGLPPINRTYQDEAGGASRTTMSSDVGDDDDEPAIDDQAAEDRKVERALEVAA
ncbi:MAG: phage portal protein [Planctomycetota bacterium]